MQCYIYCDYYDFQRSQSRCIILQISLGEATSPTEDPTIKAANVVCHVLVLNAWRRRRAEIAQLEQQVEHLHLQIEFLRRLLLAENDRVSRLNSELHREKLQLEEVTRDRDAVKSV